LAQAILVQAQVFFCICAGNVENLQK